MSKLPTLSARVSVGASAGLIALLLVQPSSAFAAAKPSLNVPCGGQAALVAAINAANTAGGGTLNLAPGCTYTLSTANNGVNGLPIVMTKVAVNGNGATINGSNAVRDLEVDGPGGNLSLQDLTVTAGSASDGSQDLAPNVGGGIFNNGGTLTLNRTRVTGNSSGTAGGGIASGTFGGTTGVLTVNASQVTGNTTAGVGAGIVNNQGVATINSSQVTGNTNLAFAGGGIASGNYAGGPGPRPSLTVNKSQVNNNSAPNGGGGGGIQNLSGDVTINDSQVNRNTSLNGAGISSGNANGGAAPCDATLVINHSEVNGNTATAPAPQPGSMGGPPLAAGGIANGCSATLNHSEVDGNTASFTSGAGIVNHGSMKINHSEVNGNTASGSGVAASGGGILNVQGPPGAVDSGVLTLDHSSVSNNHAGGNGGGISNGLLLGGPNSLPGGPVTLNHSEVTGNTAANGGGIFNASGAVALSHSSVTSNNPNNCAPAHSIPGCVG